MNMKKGKSATVGFVFCFVVMIAIMGLVTFRNREEEPEGELAETEEKPLVLEENDEEEAQVTQGDSVQAEVETEIEEANPVIKENNIIVNHTDFGMEFFNHYCASSSFVKTENLNGNEWCHGNHCYDTKRIFKYCIRSNCCTCSNCKWKNKTRS